MTTSKAICVIEIQQNVGQISCACMSCLVLRQEFTARLIHERLLLNAVIEGFILKSFWVLVSFNAGVRSFALSLKITPQQLDC